MRLVLTVVATDGAGEELKRPLSLRGVEVLDRGIVGAFEVIEAMELRRDFLSDRASIPVFTNSW